MFGDSCWKGGFHPLFFRRCSHARCMGREIDIIMRVYVLCM